MRALLIVLLAAACGGGTDGSLESASPADAFLPPVTLTPLAEGVWMHTSHEEVPPWGPIRSNGLVVETEGAVWLVDTAWSDEQTAEVLALAEAETGRPVSHAVFTHAHQDKMGGVGTLRTRGVETYALAMSNDLAPGRGLMPAEHDAVLDEDGAVELPLGARVEGIVVYHPGPAHTLDNLVVGVPRAGVLFGGCLVRPGGARDLGNTADGDVADWADAAQAVVGRFPDATIIVPSHGEPGGRALLDHTVTLATVAGG